MGYGKTKVERHPKDISPKVSVPSGLLLVAAVVWSLLNGVDVDSEQITLAVAAVVNFVVGYVKHDEVEV
jgi:hypothetical protein